MNFKKRVNGSWTGIPYYVHDTDTDTLTTLPAVLYPTGTTATVGLKGNMQQSGTPTPDNPIMPQGTGERTGNLAQSVEQGGITNIGDKTTTSIRIRVKADVSPNTTYTFASNKPISIISGFTGETFAHTIISPVGFSTQYTFTTGEDDTVVYVTLRNEDNTTIRPAALSGAMLNSGSTALPYEPYGYKILISSANTTTPVYLGEVETTRQIKKLVLDGTESWVAGKENYYFALPAFGIQSKPMICTHLDSRYVSVNNTGGFLWLKKARVSELTTVQELKAWLAAQYAAGTPVTVWYVLANEETGIVNEPLMKIGDYADEVSNVSIPVTAGRDTISVGTTVQPSEVTVNYKGWHPVQSVHERESGQWD